MHSNQPRPLFLIGNKRSGTSHLVRVLNLHPQVFVTHESDVAWILYQLTRGETPRCYPWDGPRGMKATMEACKDILNANCGNVVQGCAVAESFFQVQRRLMRNGSKVQSPYEKTNLAWIGDKKPVQQADPEVRRFIHAYFPQARFLHVVRHPQAAVASMMDAGKKWGQVAYWKLSPAEILRRWAVQENWVLAAKSEGCPVHTLRLEDLCTDPLQTIRAVFGFLELAMPPETGEATRRNTIEDPNQKHASFVLPPCEEADGIMSVYGYARG